MDIAGLATQYDQNAKATVVDTDWTDTPYHFRMGEISLNSVVYAQSSEITARIERDVSSHYYHSTISARDPFEHISGRSRFNATVNIPAHNKNLIALLRNMTKFDASYLFARGTNDILKLHLTGSSDSKNVLSRAPMRLPSTGVISIPVEISPGRLIAEIEDDIEYY